MHFLMFYEFAADYLERRDEFRNEHLHGAWAARSRGEIVLGVAYSDPADGAVPFRMRIGGRAPSICAE